VATATRTLWPAWLAMLALVAALALLPFVAGPQQAWWSEPRTLVFTFVLTLIAMAAGVGSLALRESIVRGVSSGALDPRSPEGASSLRSMLRRTWLLCLGVALLGFFVAWTSASPHRTWPYSAAAAALLCFHAPRRGALDRA
jgi:hypothetical protein